jgi:hypothetical protein
VVAGSTTADETHGRVYGINGSTGAIVWTYVPSGSSTWALMQLDDITGDGIKDVASGDFSGHIYFHNATTGAIVQSRTLSADMILRFENMGDVNKDGFKDLLVSHTAANGVIINGHDITSVWTVPLSDKAWNVTNVGDVTFDGVNDAAIGTLYSNNKVYFLKGTDGTQLFSQSYSSPVDALFSIPDIVGDQTKELVAGGREGEVICFSGGYDSATISVQPRGDAKRNNVSVYPNPVSDNLNVVLRLTSNATVHCSVSDVTGRELYSGRFSIHAGEQTIRLTTDEIFGGAKIPGTYIVGVDVGEENYKFKLVVD